MIYNFHQLFSENENYLLFPIITEEYALLIKCNVCKKIEIQNTKLYECSRKFGYIKLK